MKRKVVITGLGALTALGEGAEALWRAAIEGRSGIGFLPAEQVENGKNGHGRPLAAAVVRDFDPNKFINQRKSIKVMARDIQLAVAAASLAFEDGRAREAATPRERFGVIVGSGVLNHELDELAYSVKSSVDAAGKLDLKKFGQDGMPALFPLWLLKYLPNMSACHVSILFDLQGPNNTLTTGSSAGLQAVGEACRIIERGAADMMLAGGAESKVNPVGLSHYQILGLLSEGSDEPQRSYRPFDPSSRGIVIGEGAGFLLLEELEHAQKRGAHIYAEVAGFGASSAAGQAMAMKAAFKESGLGPEELDYLHACGFGLADEDMKEASAIESVLNGSRSLFVSATKPVMGFTGFASGALDLIISTLSAKHRLAPPVLNANGSRNWKFQLIRDRAVQTRGRAVMTNASGFGGQSVSIVIRPYGESHGA